MCEWRIFLPKLLPSDSKWIRNSVLLDQYKNKLTKLKHEMNQYLEQSGCGGVEERTDRYYVGTSDVGLKHRAGKSLEVKIRSSLSSKVVGGEHWSKCKVKKNPAGFSAYQSEVDSSTARHELIDVVKSRRRGGSKFDICYEKTAIRIEIPTTEPENNLRNTYYCGRSWATFCLEGSDSTILEELRSSSPKSSSPLALLKDCLTLCLQIRYDSVSNSCRETFFPVLSGYPSFVKYLTEPSLSLLPVNTAPLLRLMDTLSEGGSDCETNSDVPLLPDSLYAPHVDEHPIFARYLSCDSNDEKSSGRIVPYVSQDVTTPEDIVSPIRQRRNGNLLNLDRVLLHSPMFAQGWNSLFGELRGENISINPKLKELAICAVAVLNEAEYEFYQHLQPWVAAGGTEEQSFAVRQLGDGNHENFLQARQLNSPMQAWQCFDELEMDILQLTIEMTKNVKTSPDLMTRLQEKLGGNAPLVEITGVIAGYNMVSRFLVAMDISAAGEGSK